MRWYPLRIQNEESRDDDLQADGGEWTASIVRPPLESVGPVNSLAHQPANCPRRGWDRLTPLNYSAAAGKTLRRYLARELALAFLAGLALSTFVLAIMRIMELVDLAFARGVPASRVGALFGYMLPSYLEITLPMAFLLSIVVAFGRLTRDGEIVAMYSSGLNLRQLVRPIFGFAVLVAALLSWRFSLAQATRRIDETISEMARTRFTAALRPGVFSSWLEGVVIYVGAVEPDTGQLTWVMLADEREPAGRRTIFAAEASQRRPTRGRALQMRDGTSCDLGAADSYDRTDFAPST
jgi:lipopolysaccharide export system permease protein